MGIQDETEGIGNVEGFEIPGRTVFVLNVLRIIAAEHDIPPHFFDCATIREPLSEDDVNEDILKEPWWSSDKELLIVPLINIPSVFEMAFGELFIGILGFARSLNYEDHSIEVALMWKVGESLRGRPMAQLKEDESGNLHIVEHPEEWYLEEKLS